MYELLTEIHYILKEIYEVLKEIFDVLKKYVKDFGSSMKSLRESMKSLSIYIYIYDMPVNPNVTAHRAPCRPMPTQARQRPTQIGRVVIKSPYKRRTSDVQATYKPRTKRGIFSKPVLNQQSRSAYILFFVFAPFF